MSPSEIEEIIEDEPFRPFRVTVNSGDQFVINNRHRVFISGLSLVAGLSDDPDDRVGTRLKLISIPNISLIEYIDPKQLRARRRRR